MIWQIVALAIINNRCLVKIYEPAACIDSIKTKTKTKKRVWAQVNLGVRSELPELNTIILISWWSVCFLTGYYVLSCLHTKTRYVKHKINRECGSKAFKRGSLGGFSLLESRDEDNPETFLPERLVRELNFFFPPGKTTSGNKSSLRRSCIFPGWKKMLRYMEVSSGE